MRNGERLSPNRFLLLLLFEFLKLAQDQATAEIGKVVDKKDAVEMIYLMLDAGG